ncbi:E3 SUMO-protein ligase ZNF451 [Indicator indicator]|uniref:E3 SUMO-protein ligase ZNF451 n=1 Tax=Indicator indicator TaxID=1002788 RepID=UPI0023DF9CE8|nr:E3 SUMO-protein ligase ZNF451 [Indicator indicator]
MAQGIRSSGDRTALPVCRWAGVRPRLGRGVHPQRYSPAPAGRCRCGCSGNIMEASTSVSTGRSNSPSESEDEIEFIGEEPLRPVLECIDLVSSEDEEPTSSSYVQSAARRKDAVDYQKERAASTLDRLARHVEVEKQQKEERNKAFKEKVDSQYAHGLQELEFMQERSDTEAARLCVHQWLKMPGLEPGIVNSGKRGVHSKASRMEVESGPVCCPVMHCNREFENRHLLLGHLQRFDHSPCDPTVTLRGPPNNSVACVICCQRFPTPQQYNDHLSSKLKENDGHEEHLPPQLIDCFACPSCFLLFTRREECWQHMSEKSHALQASQLDDMKADVPLPFPSYAKNLLISLCKEVPFQVKCLSCRKALRSHTEVTAHFRTRCRDSGPVALSRKSITQVAEIFKTKGCCENCDRLFADKNQIAQHKQTTQHKVKLLATVEESILMFCHINGKNKKQSYLCRAADQSRLLLKRHLSTEEPLGEAGASPAKRKSPFKAEDEDQGANRSQGNACEARAWFCECLQKFLTEEAVEKHILSANGICHKCAVCGKLAESSSIIRLHMSRFHGGAHLKNFLLWCTACSVDLSHGKEDVMGHIAEFHGGHAYYYEGEAVKDETLPAAPGVACSSAGGSTACAPSPTGPSRAETPVLGEWQCRICEELFESEERVQQHCLCLESHTFHRYCCRLCSSHFRKLGTLQRHCQERHGRLVPASFFCGLCGSLFFDTEEEFLAHYQETHSRDYMFVPEQVEASIKEECLVLLEKGPLLTCGCQTAYVSRMSRRNDSARCQQAMLRRGNFLFLCRCCPATTQSLAGITRHLEKHLPRQSKAGMYFVRCGACGRDFNDIHSAHQHYHMKHCFLQNPDLSGLASDLGSAVFRFTATGACVHRKPRKKTLRPSPPKPQEQPQSSPVQGQKKGNSAPSDEGGELPDLDFLSTMTHIVLVDLDNWASLFTQLPANLNQGTFIWGFQGGYSTWKPPVQCKIYNYLKRIGCFFLHPRCGTRREAADFALCVHAGRLDEHLPKQIPFTILSGDKSFLELENQFKMTQRTARILNPHHMEGDMMCALLNSISDTTKGSDSEEDEDIELTKKRSLEDAKKLQDEQDAELEEALKRSLEEM